jgi:ubiquinone/menaquinone biosynthesis C-methylase UbiE
LQGLQNLLHRDRKRWNMVFAACGEAALDEVHKEPFDVVVSDMRMPGIDGAALLNQIKAECPGTVRIMLSGHADRDTIARALPALHQLLWRSSSPRLTRRRPARPRPPRRRRVPSRTRGGRSRRRGEPSGLWSPAMEPMRLRPLVAITVTIAVVACGRASAPRPADDLRPGGSASPGDGGHAGSAAGTAAATASPAASLPGPIERSDGRYHGRPIASTCSYLGADWLDRPEREQREQPERVLDALKLDPRSTVADVGAGTGYFTVRLARRVAHVHATDLQPEMLQRLGDRLAREQVRNVELHLATDHDAALPARCCDLILLVDVYHELADPPAVMAGIRRALTDRGRLVLVEYRGEDPAVPIKPEHKMTLRQIQQELASLGFHFLESLEFLPDQRVVVLDVGTQNSN